jgi:hypothetical protein
MIAERMIDTIRDRVNANDGLVRRGRSVSRSFLFGVGEQDYVSENPARLVDLV